MQEEDEEVSTETNSSKWNFDDDIHKVIVPPRDHNPISHILSAPVMDDNYCLESSAVDDFVSQRLCKSAQFEKQIGLYSSNSEMNDFADEDNHDDDYFMFL